ncbi:phosphopantetheine-binding protein, partial [Kitasatospora sp. NPDC056651]|uniref:phosphopantetheine-binding protein n=1 Tax=Kitasatospora sp. NPDC056651 TaxID=3345892 RepID=UPI0036AA72FC
PDYMIPTTYTPLDTIPLNANGKTNHKALPTPEPVSGEAVGVEPRTVVEEQVAEIWSELLGHESGIHDNFFQSGGNSILAIRLTAQIQSVFEVDLPVRAIFEGPTIAEISGDVERRIREEIDQMPDDEVVAALRAEKEQQ